MSADDDLLEKILNHADVSMASGAGEGGRDTAALHGPAIVSPLLGRLLERHPGGLTFFKGYLKLYGVRDAPGIDVRTWNAEPWWKFAWPSDLTRFWCFAGTAMGEQFAIETGPASGSGASAVYSLDPITMAPSVFAGSLEEFFVLLGRGPEPFISEDGYWAIVDMHGAIGIADGVTATPPRVFQPHVDARSAFLADYRTVLTINGDCFSEASKYPPGTQILGLTTYTDDQNRQRLRFRVRTN